METATIPYLPVSLKQNATVPAGATELLTGSEEQLARLGKETLQRLSERVQANAVEREPVVQVVADTPDLPEASDQTADVAIQQLVDIVLERSSSKVPVVLLFVGSEPNHHVEEVAARVAASLCDHADSRVLLVDSDEVRRSLTRAARQLPESGMTEVIEYDQDWRNNVVRNGNSNIDFLPSGNGKFGRWNEKELLRKAVCEMKSEYQFVCVAGGDAHGKASKLWSDVCDGSYLLVSVKNSNGTVAKSAVAELKASGVRLLGCVVTDVDAA